MKAAREYDYYGIDKKRFKTILDAMLKANDQDLYSIANKADWLISAYLVESIRYNVSFERLEALHGVLPTSKTDFYRKRRLMFHLMDNNLRECNK